MIKRSIAQHDITLAGSRKEFDRALLNHSMNIEIQENNARHKLLFDGAAFVSAPILNKIEVQIKLSEHIIIVKHDERENVFIAFHERSPSITYEISNDVCSCNQVSFSGYPCSHLIKLYQMSNQGFPKHLISGRWIKSKEAATVQETAIEMNNSLTYESDKVVLNEEKEEDINEL